MEKSDIVQKFAKRAIRIRCLWGILTIVSIGVGITFTILYENSKIVTETDYGILGIITTTTYNYDFIIGIVLGWALAFWCALIFVISFSLFKTKRVSVGNDDIVLYGGFIKCEMYINDTFQDMIATRFNKGYLEGKLSDGSKVTGSVSWHGYHLSFSNGHEAIDL
ncbi:MAG: hypothetical protein WCR63_04165 [Bacilli bacterium]